MAAGPPPSASDTGASSVEEIAAVLRGSDRPAVRPPLGSMSSAVLTRELVEAAERLSAGDTRALADAIGYAAHLHRDDRRKHGTRAADSPYIEHPLRNTVRLTRLGCDDGPTLIASVLHDTVEDHAFDVAADEHPVAIEDEHRAREVALEACGRRFGETVARLVRAMSNEPVPADATADEKVAAYVAHVEQAVEDPRVCALKVSDLIDNAVGLYHGIPSGMSSAAIGKRARKYLAVIPLVERRLERDLGERRIPMSDAGLATVIEQLSRGRLGIEKLAQLR